MAAIQFERSFSPEHGRCVQVSPLIQRVVCNNTGPYTFTGTGTYITGKDVVAVIDPGPDDDAHFEALKSALSGRTVSHILITHTHLDHSPLAARLKQLTGAKTYAYGPHGCGRSPVSGDVRLDAGGDMAFVPDIEIRDGDVLEGPDWTMQCVFTPGHTSNHMAFALVEENALFSGDHVMAWSTSVIAPPDGNMADYLASLKMLLARNDKVYWPTHGGPKYDPKPFVRAFITHRRMREKAILRRIEKGDHNITGMVKAIYADVDPRLHPAAAMSVLAHLHHLLDQEKITVEGKAGLEGVYRLKG